MRSGGARRTRGTQGACVGLHVRGSGVFYTLCECGVSFFCRFLSCVNKPNKITYVYYIRRVYLVYVQ
jgi:hypothetical protein